MKQEILEYLAAHFRRILEATVLNTGTFAEIYVKDRMEFHRKFQKGLIFSTVHGANFFENVHDCLLGRKWSEKDAKGVELLAGEYEDNFRKFLKAVK